ncbi:hypothetical protein BW723_03915 [Polaribacter reichenbachii]|uniref:TonB-dependent receptor plug domain-containing protein n=1 Tax=Polaribacter reichenbachii TaxID=996801 RepID=A0A1B8TVF0_9FLAO|nr:TonB-dependent receptor plug domain-containing protein [Polaribacter reichenbachii]APZ45495.1 hypothetical protein BW723_03915 [Polaribacter reichenbachii]AUC19356.1 hypothetical protein BTO17_11920 [Polaribacter reichenbachii]OBY63489.1 hypothetical protein LPB301_11790 [Polaribacter reichenbachii]
MIQSISSHKKKLYILTLFVCLGLLYNCSSVNKTTASKTTQKIDKKTENESLNIDLSLANQLRKVAGVSVQGNGMGAIIFIRGKSSINMKSDPLFLINDQIINGGYSAVYNMLDPRDIIEIEVLKNANETSPFGVRGANGVIKITTK